MPREQSEYAAMILTVVQPRSEEAWAEGVVAWITRDVVQHIDDNRTPREVDALIHRADGKVHALEITTMAQESQFQVERAISRIKWRWPTPGNWTWTVGIASYSDYKRLDRCFAHVALLCERWRVPDPSLLPPEVMRTDADARWIGWDSASTMHGHIPSSELPFVYVGPAAHVGVVDESLNGLPGAVSALLTTDNGSRHVRKLLDRAGVDGRELFLIVRDSGLQHEIYYELLDPQMLPTEPPDVDAGIDRVWLATGTVAVVTWDREHGWSRHDLPQRAVSKG